MFQCQADRSRIIISTRGIMEENRMRRASIVNQFFSRRDAAQLRIRYNKSSPDRFEELRERLYPTIDNGLMNFHVCTFGFWNSERIRINYTYVIRARGSSTHIRYKIRTRLSVTVYLADTVENSRPPKVISFSHRSTYRYRVYRFDTFPRTTSRRNSLQPGEYARRKV